MRKFLATIALIFAAQLGWNASAQQVANLDIAPTGKLRFGMNATNSVLTSRDANGTISGISIELGNFIAQKIGAAFEPVHYPSTGDFIRSFGKGEWDITIVGTSPGAKQKFNFTQDVILVDYVFLAAPGRHFANIGEIDRPGIKVAASENGSGSQFLSATLKSAQLVLAPGSLETTVELLRTGKIDAYGSIMSNLLLVADRLPGATFVPGAFQTVHFAVAIQKDRSPLAQEYLSTLVGEAKASGLLQGAIERAGLKGVRVAPNQ